MGHVFRKDREMGKAYEHAMAIRAPPKPLHVPLVKAHPFPLQTSPLVSPGLFFYSCPPAPMLKHIPSPMLHGLSAHERNTSDRFRESRSVPSQQLDDILG
ncbi:hypothetical protein BT63DRAFT_455197 [Microthyrium microscopicum]|uniref:Uncharacterized protein n=1 Tax=Microthyrium microscopicum TaxID=703497 RepID=A0A6A6UCP3_9PEZI|nr:hypothetical protein BT63DRAFT_455197 [Microthyrium microscopicum]